jgi:hypothetical protein
MEKQMLESRPAHFDGSETGLCGWCAPGSCNNGCVEWENSHALTIAPITVKAAQLLVAEWHRHLKAVQGGLFAAALTKAGVMVGVGIAANPARVWQGTGKFVIARIAVKDGVHNGCSMLYGALCRAGKALGYSEAWTYTLPHEPGTSLRAAGFKAMGMTRAEEHSREKRPRKPAVNAGPKQRWVRYLSSPASGGAVE